MEDKTTKRIIVFFTMLVLCFCSCALAEDLNVPAEPETPVQTVEQQPSEGSALSESSVIAPAPSDESQAEAADEENTQAETPASQTEQNPQPEADPSETVSEESTQPETETPEAQTEQNPQPEADSPETGEEESTQPETETSEPQTDEEEQPGGKTEPESSEEETNACSDSGHQWEAVSYSEATCTEDGIAVRRCAVCGTEETIVLPAFGHTFVLSSTQEGSGSQYVCAVCGEVQEAPEGKTTQSHMYYNNTVTSFGPTTRELIGGSVWNRVTPVDLSQEGVFTYPLVASNMYTVGTATLVNNEDSQQVNYKLSSNKINVHSESLVVYPDLEALKTGENAQSFDFNAPIDLKGYFGEDARVIVAITLKADYDADSAGVRRFSADQTLINQMMDMLK